MSGKSPWWQTTKTVRSGLLLGCGYVVAGSIELAFAITGPAALYMWIMGPGFLAIGLVHLISVVATLRRQRSFSVQDGRSAMPDSTPPTL